MIFNAALPVYLAGGVGLAARLIGLLSAEADESLMRLTVRILIPCLILKALLNNSAASDPRNLLVAPVIGFGLLVISCMICWIAGGVIRLPEVQRRTFAFVVGNYNYGFIALPLVMALFDRSTLGVLFVHNLGVDIGLWTTSVLILQGGNWRTQWQKIFSPPVLAVFAGVVLNVLHLSPLLPDVVVQSLGFLGNCAVPLSLILTGAILCDFRRELRMDQGGLATLSGAALRMAIIPAGFLLAAWLLPLGPELKKILVVMAAMPAAMFPIVLTRLHGGDVGLALRQVVVTSLISFGTIPLVIHFGLRLVAPSPGG